MGEWATKAQWRREGISKQDEGAPAEGGRERQTEPRVSRRLERMTPRDIFVWGGGGGGGEGGGGAERES